MTFDHESGLSRRHDRHDRCMSTAQVNKSLTTVQIPRDKITLHGAGAFQGGLFLQGDNKNIESVFTVAELADTLQGFDVCPEFLRDIGALVGEWNVFNMV